VTEKIVEGIELTSTGEAKIAQGMSETLMDLAIALEGPTGLPVDIEHVVAALIMASRAGQLNGYDQLSADDTALLNCLRPHVEAIFHPPETT